MSRFQISPEEYEAIKIAEKGSKDKRTSKRLRMLMLRYEGYKVEEIAKMYGTRKEWISQVCRKYREQGLEEFIRNKYNLNESVFGENIRFDGAYQESWSFIQHDMNSLNRHTNLNILLKDLSV